MIKISNNKLIKMYTVLSFIILAFVENSAGSVPLKIPHIEYNKGYLLLFLTVITIIISLLFRIKKNFGAVELLLFARCIWDLIPVVIDKSLANSSFWYYYSMVFSMPLIYFIFTRYTGSLRVLINYITIFSILLVFQLLITVILNGYGFDDSLYKYYLRIPFAHSNIIGAVLLSILFFRIVSQYKKGIDFVINVIIVLGLILIKSVGSQVFLIGWLVIVQVLDAKRKKNHVKIVIISLLVAFGVSLIIVSKKIQLMLFSSTLINLDISKLTSRRTDLWRLAILKWLTNPWFGCGLGITEYNVGVEIILTGVHNIVLDFAVQSGIIGLGLYFTAIVKGFNPKNNTKNIKERNGLFVSIIILLGYSMVEVTYFHYVGIFFFWMYMGLYNAKTKINLQGK